MRSEYYNYDQEYQEKRPSRWKNEVYKTVAPDRSKKQRYEMIESHSVLCDMSSISGGFPWFILLITFWQIGYYFYMYYTADPKCDWNSWCTYQFHDNIFIFDPKKAMNKSNPEVWRFFTYSFVHAGWEHLLGNMLMQLIIGIPLEYCHGTMRVMSLYSIGVVVGSFTALIVTPNALLVGASGGDFCLISAVIANVILNCDSMHVAMALLRVLIMGAYLGMEVYMSIRRYMANEGSISWAAHLGGAVTGLTLGVLLLRNLEKKTCERIFTAILVLIFALYIGACVGVWMLIVNPDNDIDSALDVENISQMTDGISDK